MEDATAQEKCNVVVRRYLSRQHRDMGESGCPLPATLSEIENADALVAAAFNQGIAELVERLAPFFEDVEGITARQRAMGTIATLVGAMALARATKGSPLSDEVLLSGRKLLLQGEGTSK